MLVPGWIVEELAEGLTVALPRSPQLLGAGIRLKPFLLAMFYNLTMKLIKYSAWFLGWAYIFKSMSE